jgi:superoxide dismutase, Fe-Mn family
MDALIQALPFDPRVLPGLSERLLRSHHANNYSGAVKRLNAIRARLASLSFETTPGFELNGLKREELIACNSMLLHELHFASMGGERSPMVPAMELALCASFGSVARWRDEFVDMGKALAGGADAGRWVDAFMANLNWAAAYQNYQHAVEGASDMFGASADELAGAAVVDVRRAGVFEAATTVLPGAQWRDPVAVQQWAQALEPDKAVVVYCVYGHEVCRATAMRLRAQGRNARFLRGGIDAWQKSGLPLVPKSGMT